MVRIALACGDGASEGTSGDGDLQPKGGGVPRRRRHRLPVLPRRRLPQFAADRRPHQRAAGAEGGRAGVARRPRASQPGVPANRDRDGRRFLLPGVADQDRAPHRQHQSAVGTVARGAADGRARNHRHTGGVLRGHRRYHAGGWNAHLPVSPLFVYCCLLVLHIDRFAANKVAQKRTEKYF